MKSDSPPNKAGYVAIVGKPNVGKSSLLNALLRTKLSIVSSKPQTTRDPILGILNTPDAQVVFFDTPGWMNPADNLQKKLKTSVLRAMEKEADVILWVSDLTPMNDEEDRLQRRLESLGKPMLLVLNKVDGQPAAAVQRKRDHWLSKRDRPDEIIEVSARTGSGLPTLLSKIVERLPVSPAYFPPDQLTDRWERFYAAELIREQVFEQFHEEIPHATAVQISEFIEKPGDKDYIRANLYVESEGQKAIVIGKKGSAIRKLGEAARKEIEAFIGRPIFLELRVRIQKNWRKDDTFLSSLHSGYE